MGQWLFQVSADWSPEIVDESLGVVGCVLWEDPLVVLGTVATRPFHYRGDHNSWYCVISDALGADPFSAFPCDPLRSFYCEKEHRLVELSARYATLDEARVIIANCCEEYLQSKNLGGIEGSCQQLEDSITAFESHLKSFCGNRELTWRVLGKLLLGDVWTSAGCACPHDLQ